MTSISEIRKRAYKVEDTELAQEILLHLTKSENCLKAALRKLKSAESKDPQEGPFKPGEKIVCIRAEDTDHLTLGKIYTVRKMHGSGHSVYINDERGSSWGMDRFRSVVLEEAEKNEDSDQYWRDPARRIF